MAVGVVMPKAGITVEECVITEWLKKKGDHVNVGASGAENIKWVLVLVWPILLAGVGIFVWLRRKGR